MQTLLYAQQGDTGVVRAGGCSQLRLRMAGGCLSGEANRQEAVVRGSGWSQRSCSFCLEGRAPSLS